MAQLCIECDSDKIDEVVKENKRYFFCHACQKLHDRAIDTAYGADVTIPTEKGIIHLIAGALIKNGRQFLLIKRRAYPFGYALPAGHIEYGETPLETLHREILEETGLKVKKSTLLFEGEIHNKCRYGADRHIWYFYKCQCEPGIPLLNPESEGIGWYSPEEVSSLNLIPSARYLFNEVIRK